MPISQLEVGFTPTVCGHTKYTDGYELETIDPDPERNIEIWDDERPPSFVGDDSNDE